ncbi:MAG: 4a-hydroxytetrahydrobiopterin dehydratase [Blastocatellia bacterium]
MTCSAATPTLTIEEITARLSRLNGWSFGEGCIEKTFEFKNFLRAISFVNAVGYLAESINHHPDIIIRYNEVTLRNWTHAARGVTEFDFELARKIDALGVAAKSL